MDEIEFTREQLRRSLGATTDALATAAEHYEGDGATPLFDSLACAALASLGLAIREYLAAVSERTRKLGVHLDPES